MVVTVKNWISRSSFVIECSSLGLTGKEVKLEVSAKQALPFSIQRLYVNGKCLSNDDSLQDGGLVHVCFSLPGGKGGFGSMLRAIGAQIEKTTNREACRDLSGRRLRDINEEKRLKDWISKQAEREQDSHKKKIEKLERMRAKPKHEFHDPEYDRQRSQLPEDVAESVQEGLKKDVSAVKRKPTSQKGPVTKKGCLWMGMEGLEDDDSEGSDSDQKKAEGLAHRDRSGSDYSTRADESNTWAKPASLDLSQFSSLEQLESLGEEALGSALSALGAKGGGTLRQRAERLWALKGKGSMLKKLSGPPDIML